MHLFFGDFRALADVVPLVGKEMLGFVNLRFEHATFNGRSALHNVESLLGGVRLQGGNPVVWAFDVGPWLAGFSDPCGSGLFDSRGRSVVPSVPGRDDEESHEERDWSQCSIPRCMGDHLLWC